MSNEIMASSTTPTSLSEFKVPLRPTSSRRRRPQKVLDEDDYVESISHIIEKDFFPDLAEMREGASAEPSTASKLSSNLDSFLARHTGEDNESFHELMEKSSTEESHKKEWLYLQPQKDEALSSQEAIQSLEVPCIEDQASGTLGNQPLQGWKYKSNNSVFYPVEGVPLSQTEEIEKAKKERLVIHANTRFTMNPWRDSTSSSSLSKKREGIALGKVGADGKELDKPGETPSVNGYKFMRIDSPALDPSESPLMTWGQLDSTPLRIDDSPYVNGGGQFKIQKVPERDQIALQLTEKNAKFYRDKKQKAIQKATRNMKSPSSTSLRIASMSPAAQRLATSKLGIRLGTDKSSSSRTPTPRIKNPSTPLKDVISNSIRSKSTTPRSSNDLTDGLLKINATQSNDCLSEESLTDNLLNISKRPKASDFF